METANPICLYCGDVIGVDEPLVLVEHAGERETSLASEPELAQRPRALMLHSACAPEGWRSAS